VEPAARKELDLDALGEQIRATVERQKENDPAELRRRLRDAEARIAIVAEGAAREWRAKMEDALAQVAPHVVEVPVIDEATLRLIHGHVLDVENAADRLNEQYERLREVLYPIAANVRDALDRAAKAARQATEPPKSPPKQPRASAPPPPPAPVEGTGTTVKRAEQRILDAIRWFGLIHAGTPPTKQQVGFLAGYRVGKSIGGTYGNTLGKLRSKGLIDYPSPGTVALTAEGARLANDPGIEVSNESVQDAVRARLKPAEVRVLDVLIAAWPHPLRKQEIGERAGYTVGPSIGGTFGNILGRLHNTLGVIEYPAPGEARASDALFPLG
jgi:hypothetical protein